MVLQNGAVFLFTTTPRMIETPLSYQNVQLGDLRLPMARLYALVLGVAAFGALYLILHHTRLGKAMRGVAQNRAAAMMVGIDTRVVVAARRRHRHRPVGAGRAPRWRRSTRCIR